MVYKKTFRLKEIAIFLQWAIRLNFLVIDERQRLIVSRY